MLKVTRLIRQNSKWEIVKEHYFTKRNYKIDSFGNFYRNDKIIKNKPLKVGYTQVFLKDDNNESVRFKIHQIVGQVFYPNQLKDYLTFDHKDRNKLNNNVSNIRIADRKTQYSNRENIKYKQKKVKCLNNNKIYDSCLHAQSDLKIKNVARVARGERKSVHGYKFKYI